MSEEAVLQWLLSWFASRGVEVAGRTTENIFDLGFIDSFGVVELIEAIETQFTMRFLESDFQDRRFPTLAGLSSIIIERLA